MILRTVTTHYWCSKVLDQLDVYRRLFFTFFGWGSLINLVSLLTMGALGVRQVTVVSFMTLAVLWDISSNFIFLVCISIRQLFSHWYINGFVHDHGKYEDFLTSSNTFFQSNTNCLNNFSHDLFGMIVCIISFKQVWYVVFPSYMHSSFSSAKLAIPLLIFGV